MHLKEQIPRSVVVQCFPKSCLAYLLDPSQALWPSPLYYAWNSQRKGECWRQQQCPLSGSDQGFIVRKSPLSGTSLSAPSNRPSAPHPGPPPEDDFKALWKWKVALLHKKKRLGEIKWLTLILFRNPSELASLSTPLPCWKGNLFQKHWVELTNSLCM